MTRRIDTIVQTLEVATVVDVIVTTIEQLETGQYVRELRIMTKEADEQDSTLALTLRLIGDELAALHVTSPSSEF